MSAGTGAPDFLPRGLLFVPGDSERKQERALGSEADALILDLEDSVAGARREEARLRVCSVLKSGGARPALWVRVNPPGSPEFERDLAALSAEPAIMRALSGLVLPKVSSPAALIATARAVEAREAGLGLRRGQTRLLPIVTETARAVLTLPLWPDALQTHPEIGQRLFGLTWGSEDLGAALGAQAARDAHGVLTPTFAHARTLCLLAASALEVPAFDTVNVDFRNAEALERELREARRDGFAGKLAIHPAQVAPIQAAFTPGPEEQAWAARVVACFEAAPDQGVVGLDGRMLDRPHLLQARRILANVARPARAQEP